MTHIDILELKTVHLGILTFTKFKIAQRIHVQMDNKVALSYLVRWGNLNHDLLSLSKQIWDYLLSKKIAVTAEYLLGNLNVQQIGSPGIFKTTAIDNFCRKYLQNFF